MLQDIYKGTFYLPIAIRSYEESIIPISQNCMEPNLQPFQIQVERHMLVRLMTFGQGWESFQDSPNIYIWSCLINLGKRLIAQKILLFIVTLLFSIVAVSQTFTLEVFNGRTIRF